MHNSSWFDEVGSEQGIPTMITWSHGGKEVAVEGSWDNWKMKYVALFPQFVVCFLLD